MKIKVCLTSALPLFLSLNLFAVDELLLNNGEVLLGTYIQTEDGNITFKSDSLGEVTVPAGNATIRQGVPADKAVPTEQANVPSSNEAAAAATQTQSKGWVRELLNLPDEVTGNVSGGWSNLSGTTTGDSISTNFSLGFQKDTIEWNLFGSYTYGKYNGTVSSDNQRYGGWYKWYFMDDGRWFLHLQSSWYQDRVQRLQAEIDGLVGLGYYFLKLDNYQWQLSLGANYDDKDYFDVSGFAIADINAWKVGFFEHFTAQPLPYINISHTFFYSFDPTNSANYDYQLNFTISTPITANTSIGLAYDRTWNGAIPPEFQSAGIEKDNSTTSLQLGYKF